MTLGWHGPILWQGQIWSPMLCKGKRLNNGFFRNYCSLWCQSWSMQSSKWTFMNIKGQGHSLTVVQGNSNSTFQASFSSKLLGWLKPNFMWSLHGMGNESEYTNGLCHMTKMAAMPINGTNLKRSSLESKSRWPWMLVCSIRCLSTTKFVQMMILVWHWHWVKFGPLCFCMGKKVKQWIFQKLL